MIDINPVRATLQKCDGQNCGIQEINDTCYGICGSYSQTFNNYDMSPACSNQCANLVEAKKLSQYSVGNCDKQTPYLPVFWTNAYRYFPKFLQKTKNPRQSLQLCFQSCATSAPHPNECIDDCKLDYSALTSPSKRQFENNRTLQTSTKTNPFHNVGLWIGVGVLGLVILLVIVFGILSRNQ